MWIAIRRTSDTGDGFPARQISNMDKGVVE